MEKTAAGPAVELISRDDLARVIDDPALRRLAFQPIVDLVGGAIVGYEALARVDASVKAPPDMWFAAAHTYGLDGVFGAAFLNTALSARGAIPNGSFLSINVDPNALSLPQMADALASAGDLTGLVFELTEDTHVTDYGQLLHTLKDLRSRGADVAIDDAGSGYSGLEQLRLLEPGFVKIDRSLIAGINRDAAKAALVEMLGQFATRNDAKVVAEGIENVEELEALIGLHVALGQGYLLGHPEPQPQGIRDLVAIHIRNCAGARNASGETIDDLLEEVPILGSRSNIADALKAFAADPDLVFLPVVDPSERPVALMVRPEPGSEEPSWAAVRSVMRGSLVTNAARSALTRSARTRFHPLVCVDDVGRYAGFVALERLVDRLAILAADD